MSDKEFWDMSIEEQDDLIRKKSFEICEFMKKLNLPPSVWSSCLVSIHMSISRALRIPPSQFMKEMTGIGVRYLDDYEEDE